MSWGGVVGGLLGFVWLFGVGAYVAEGREGSAALAIVAPPYGFIHGAKVLGELVLDLGRNDPASTADKPKVSISRQDGRATLSRPTVPGGPDTALLFSICKDGIADPTLNNPKFAACSGTALGLLAADFLGARRICLPNGIDTKATINSFLTFASSVEDERSNGATNFYRALLYFFPCRN